MRQAARQPKEKSMNDFNHLDQRITRVEAHYESLSASLHSGFAEIKQIITANQGQTRSEIDALLHRIDNKTKPQTGVWFQILGVGLSIAVIAGQIAASRISRLEEQNYRAHSEIQLSVSELSEDLKSLRSEYNAMCRDSHAESSALGQRLRAIERVVFND